MIAFGGSSRQSLVVLRQQLDKSLAQLLANDCTAISDDLFNALAVLDSSASLRRALTDPARDGESKSALIEDLFSASLGAPAVALLRFASTLRWSSPSQLSDAIEQVAVEVEATAANLTNQLDQVQSDLFAFSKILLDSPELRRAFNASDDSPAHKQDLLVDLFAKVYVNSSVRLLSQLLRGFRGRNIESTLAAYTHAITARLNRVNVHVKSAIALSDSQRSKLSAALTKQIGKPIHLNMEIDPSVVGGVSVRFADEVIDGTIVNRLAEARDAVVG
jgi:F-type H+-transporting ATPase subunit delta